MSAQQKFDHRVAVHGSDDEFLAAAVPFLLEGVAAENEPAPLMVSTPAKLGMVRDALGSDARHVEFVASADWYFGSAANALAQAAGYVATNAGPDGKIHAIAEPDWTGRAGSSPRETAEWIRYEAMVNVLLAPFAVTAMCPYDTRVTHPDVVEAARRTHPAETVAGTRRPCAEYAAPLELIAGIDAAPLPPYPADAAMMHLGDDPAALGRFVWAQAREHGMPPHEASVFESAVAEVAHLAAPGAIARMWPVPSASVCEVHCAGSRIEDVLIGFYPPDALELEPGQGLWFTRQVCDYVDVRSGADDWTIRMQYGRT